MQGPSRREGPPLSLSSLLSKCAQHTTKIGDRSRISSLGPQYPLPIILAAHRAHTQPSSQDKTTQKNKYRQSCLPTTPISAPRISRDHLLGSGALSLAGTALPLESLTDADTDTTRGGGVSSLAAILFRRTLPPCCCCCCAAVRDSSLRRRLRSSESMPTLSSGLSSSPSSSSSSYSCSALSGLLASASSMSSPSAVSWSGGETHSWGTMQGRARPMLAARLIQAGAGLPVSCSQRYEVKWLQLFERRL